MRTDLQWAQMALRWIYENGIDPAKRPTWVNQTLDSAWSPVRQGLVSRSYPPNDHQITKENTHG